MSPVEQDKNCNGPLEVEVLSDVIDECLKSRTFRLRRDVQGLSNLETLL